jgi:hypothetical protein
MYCVHSAHVRKHKSGYQSASSQVSLMSGAKDFTPLAPTLQVLELVMYRWDVRKKREREEGGRVGRRSWWVLANKRAAHHAGCACSLFSPLVRILSRVLSATYCESDLDHVEEKNEKRVIFVPKKYRHKMRRISSIFIRLLR